MSEIYKGKMTHERFIELSANGSKKNLSSEELADGWHFCTNGWDSMLIHKTDEEINYCECETARLAYNAEEAVRTSARYLRPLPLTPLKPKK